MGVSEWPFLRRVVPIQARQRTILYEAMLLSIVYAFSLRDTEKLPECGRDRDMTNPRDRYGLDESQDSMLKTTG